MLSYLLNLVPHLRGIINIRMLVLSSISNPCYLCSMITATFSYDKPKVIQALRFHFIKRKEIRWLIIVVNLFAILSAALFYMKQVTPFAFMISSLLWVLLLLNFWFIMPHWVYKRSPLFKDKLTATIDDQGLRLSNEKGHSDWGWQEFTTWLESPHFFHLYLGERIFLILPKEAFQDEDVMDIRKQLKDRLKTV